MSKSKQLCEGAQPKKPTAEKLLFMSVSLYHVITPTPGSEAFWDEVVFFMEVAFFMIMVMTVVARVTSFLFILFLDITN